MLWLVETDLPSAGKPDLDDGAPSGFLHVRAADALCGERRDLGLQVVTHEVELVPVIFVGRMKRRLGRRQREDEPSAAGVDGCESEDVTEKGAISGHILAVHDYVRAEDHEPSLNYASNPPAIAS